MPNINVSSKFKSSHSLRAILLAFTIIAVLSKAFGQVTVNSSNGYSVFIDITPKSIVAPSSCPYGYNYNVEIDYVITFSGSNIPSNLWTLQGSLTCGSQGNFFGLPNSGGIGTTTSSSNPYVTSSDCATATTNSLGCSSGTIEIQGPGIPRQTIAFNANVLPIELISFTSTESPHGIKLNWATATELNNDFFTVEKSLDGKTYEYLAKVQGNGTSNEIIEYEYSDNEFAQSAYYRLSQTDFDGTSKVKGEIFAEKSNKSSLLTLFPNPNSKNEVRLDYSGDLKGKVFVYNLAGVKLIEKSLNNEKVLTLDLSPGLYMIVIQDTQSGQIHQTKYIRY